MPAQSGGAELSVSLGTIVTIVRSVLGNSKG